MSSYYGNHMNVSGSHNQIHNNQTLYTIQNSNETDFSATVEQVIQEIQEIVYDGNEFTFKFQIAKALSGLSEANAKRVVAAYGKNWDHIKGDIAGKATLFEILDGFMGAIWDQAYQNPRQWKHVLIEKVLTPLMKEEQVKAKRAEQNRKEAAQTQAAAFERSIVSHPLYVNLLKEKQALAREKEELNARLTQENRKPSANEHNLQIFNSRLKSQKQELEASNKVLQEQLTQTKRDLTELTVLFEKTCLEKKELEKNLTQASDAQKSLKNKITKLQGQLNLAALAYDALEKKCNPTQNPLITLSDQQIDELASQLNELDPIGMAPALRSAVQQGTKWEQTNTKNGSKNKEQIIKDVIKGAINHQLHLMDLEKLLEKHFILEDFLIDPIMQCFRDCIQKFLFNRATATSTPMRAGSSMSLSNENSETPKEQTPTPIGMKSSQFLSNKNNLNEENVITLFKLMEPCNLDLQLEQLAVRFGISIHNLKNNSSEDPLLLKVLKNLKICQISKDELLKELVLIPQLNIEAVKTLLS